MAHPPASQPAAIAPLGRRAALRAGLSSAGGLLISAITPAAAPARAAGRPAMAGSGTAPAALGGFVAIDPSGAVSIGVPSQEMGQGVLSGLAQIVAEELRCNWSDVTPMMTGPAAAYVNPLNGAQITAASSSVRGYYPVLLQAGAAAREMLIAAAASKLGVPASACTAKGGRVIVIKTGKSLHFGAVAAAAALLPVPANPPLYSRRKTVLLGTSVPRPDIPSKVTGAAIYGLDVRVPGMLLGAVRMCPVQGGSVASMGRAPAGSIAVNLGRGVAVVLQASPSATTWAAAQAARKLAVSWNIPQASLALSSGALMAQARTLMGKGSGQVAEALGDYAGALKSAAKRQVLTYSLPYLAHATAEVPCCTASVTATGCEIWAPTQAPGLAAAAAAAAAGVPVANVTVHPVLMGGGLGRKLETDFITYAVLASKAAGAPVKLTWLREQEMIADQYRPMALAQVTLGLTAAGDVSAFGYRQVSASILRQRGYLGAGQVDDQAMEGAVGLPYALGARQIAWVEQPAGVAIGFWRSVGFSINCFAIESALDELALAQGVDPLALRMKLLAGNARAQNVLGTLATLSSWGSPPAPGLARGLAYVECFGSLCATAVEVTSLAGQIVVSQVWCAVDCGRVINPDTATQQIEGAVTQGLGSALWNRMLFIKGAAQTNNFLGYTMPRLADVPPISVRLIETPGAPLGGLGEVGLPGMAPALANAWARLTGVRLRDLPLFP